LIGLLIIYDGKVTSKLLPQNFALLNELVERQLRYLWRKKFLAILAVIFHNSYN